MHPIGDSRCLIAAHSPRNRLVDMVDMGSGLGIEDFRIVPAARDSAANIRAEKNPAAKIPALGAIAVGDLAWTVVATHPDRQQAVLLETATDSLAKSLPLPLSPRPQPSPWLFLPEPGCAESQRNREDCYLLNR